jgi:hypothetical protein
MSILLPKDRHWAVSNWIARGFLDDCVPFLHQAPLLRADIQFCIDAELDTLDLESADHHRLQELKELVAAVIEANQAKQGSNFADPGAFPLYMEKLTDLSQLLTLLLRDTNTGHA